MERRRMSNDLCWKPPDWWSVSRNIEQMALGLEKIFRKNLYGVRGF